MLDVRANTSILVSTNGVVRVRKQWGEFFFSTVLAQGVNNWFDDCLDFIKLYETFFGLRGILIDFCRLQRFFETFPDLPKDFFRAGPEAGDRDIAGVRAESRVAGSDSKTIKKKSQKVSESLSKSLKSHKVR